jgi:hypothetical protein
MLLGIVIGAIIAITGGIVCEVRVTNVRREMAEMSAEIANKNDKIQEMRGTLKGLLDASGELVHDYIIVAKLLENEIGKDEAYQRYTDKKNEKPKDINELLAEIKGKKENSNAE